MKNLRQEKELEYPDREREYEKVADSVGDSGDEYLRHRFLVNQLTLQHKVVLHHALLVSVCDA